jgi:nucleotide-binding universal stress UspA family protein
VKILVATDGSDHAVDAAVRGLAVLGTADSVTMLCVVHTPAVVSSGMESGFAGGMATPEVVDAAWVGAKEEAEASIDRTVAALPDGLTIERRIETGEPGLAVVAAAEELGVDVIVIGSRGRGAIKRALLGSVSTHVVHHAPCPVLVVNSRHG